MTATPDIAIVIPVYDEEGNALLLAEEVAAAMRGVRQSYEILFVDDASTDSTWEEIRRAQSRDNHIRALRHQRNAGQSAALWTGIQATASPVLVTLDGDRQNDPADIPRLLAELAQVDFVCGVRTKRKDNWVRRLSTRIARAARRSVLKVDFSDTGCACRAFKRSALDGVFPFNGMHRFLPVLVHINGARTKEIPITHRERVAGQSKYGVWNRVWRGIYDLIAIAWYQRRRLPRIPTTNLESAEVSPREPQALPRETEITALPPKLRPVQAE